MPINSSAQYKICLDLIKNTRSSGVSANSRGLVRQEGLLPGPRLEGAAGAAHEIPSGGRLDIQ